MYVNINKVWSLSFFIPSLQKLSQLRMTIILNANQLFRSAASNLICLGKNPAKPEHHNMKTLGIIDNSLRVAFSLGCCLFQFLNIEKNNKLEYIHAQNWIVCGPLSMEIISSIWLMFTQTWMY